jgi:cytochrome b
MENNRSDKHNEDLRSSKVLVWDLPTRLFHWLLVVSVILSFVTGNIGPNAMEYHMLSGYVILALLIFRVVWGFVGSQTARFSGFVKGPSTVFAHVVMLLKKEDTPYLGHNPLGGWSIIAMLLVLSVQVATGLFANDDIFTEGPLYLWVSKETSDFLTGIHLINRFVLAALLAIHVFAVLFYFFYKGDNLIGPMITGVKRWHTATESAGGRNLLAAVVFGLAILAVYILVR